MPATRLRLGLRRAEQVASLVAGIACWLRGWSYLPYTLGDSSPAQLAYLDGVIPLWVYAFAWMLVLPLAVSTFWVRRMWVVTLAVVAALSSLWCASFLASWLILDTPRAWVSATSFGLVAVFAGVLIRVGTLGERLAALVDSIIRGEKIG